MSNEFDWMLCIAGLICAGVRANSGEKLEKIVTAGGWNNPDAGSPLVQVYNIAGNTWETGE